jgi:hypothetical protein
MPFFISFTFALVIKDFSLEKQKVEKSFRIINIFLLKILYMKGVIINENKRRNNTNNYR